MKPWWTLWLLLMLVPAQAAELRLQPGQERYSVGAFLRIWEDPSAQLGPDEALTHLDRFVLAGEEKVTRGYSRSAWWFYLPLSSAIATEWLAHVDYSALDYLDVWQIRSGEAPRSIFSGGDHLPFPERPVLLSTFLIPFTLQPASLQPSEPEALLIRVQTQGAVIVPLQILSKTAFIEDQERERLLLGGLWGGLLCLMLYNLLLHRNVRDRVYLYYCAYILAFVAGSMHLTGLGFHYLWPYGLWVQTGGLPILFLLASLMAVNFSRLLLDLKHRHPRLDRVLLGYGWLHGACMVVFPFLPFQLSLYCTVAVVLSMGFFLMTAGMMAFVNRYPPGRNYMLAWICVFIAVLIFALETMGLTHGTFISKWSLLIGAVMEALLFAVAMSDRISLFKQQTLQAQQKVVEQEKLLRLAQENANRVLEQRVDQRTRELAKVVEDLARVNEKLDRINQLDELTLVFNRRAFNQRSSLLLAQCKREQRSLAVLLLDIDHFKRVNDCHGHLAGDECLRRVAALVQARVTRPQDFVARLGGEEFVVVLYDTEEEGAIHVAEKIRVEIQQMPMRWEDRTIHLTVSVGLCCGVPSSWHEVEHFTGWADQALYQAKSRGRNQLVRRDLMTALPCN
ncbi:MAG TPA: diguanylate cyclase [Dongiaceae bacterium]|nr:diguanylate cyclase [Dongiaceae bacterium]